LFVFTLACLSANSAELFFWQKLAKLTLFVDRGILHKSVATEQAPKKWMALVRSVQKRGILDAAHQYF